MFQPFSTSRRVVSFLLLLMLVFRSITAVAAAHLEQHCDGHDPNQDCSCCSAAMMAAGGCAALCSINTPAMASAVTVSRATAESHHRLTIEGSFGPTYLPLNPPPIS